MLLENHLTGRNQWLIKPNANNMNVIPVNFSTEHKEMLSHLAMLVSKSYLAITKTFDKLEIALRTAYADVVLAQ